MKALSGLIKGLFIATLILAFHSNCSRPGEKTSSAKGELKGTISISGAFALYPIAVKWADEFKKLNPGVIIDISAGGAGKGLTDALSGMVDLGMFSRGLTQAELDKGVWYISVTKDAVLPVINASNPYISVLTQQGVTKDEFYQIFVKSSIASWGQLLKITGTEKIHTYTRSDACGAAEIWAEYVGMHQENLQGTGVFGDPGIASAVKNDPLGIGYNNVIYVYDIQRRVPYPDLAVVPIDLNNNGVIDPEEQFYDTLDDIMAAIRDGIYPSPPARPLYFVSNGKPPKREVIEFLRWILVHGQEFVDAAGYVALPCETIETELKKLE